jgi:integrase/recombinase XerD
MPSDPGFAGPQARLFEEFIAFRRSLGYQVAEDSVRKYRLLASHIASFPADPRVLTAEMAEAFLDPGGRAPGTVRARRNTVRQFALFLRRCGIDCWEPPGRFEAIPAPRFNPRIITSQEMARVIAVADAMPPSPSSPSGAAVYGMLLRMLWCCGLRISEALHLRAGDVDLNAAVITVRKAKGGKTRLVPMSPSLAGHARHYAGQVGLGAEDPQAFFYPSARGGHYQPAAVLRRVQSFMLQAGVTTDGARPPRLHDIRHSYAVAALAKMHASGMDAYASLPLLATFLGHSTIGGTEYYLRLTGPGAAQLAADSTAAHPGLYPKAAD